MTQSVEFINVADENIQDCFRRVVEQYTPLAGHRMVLCQKKIGKTTMQAQPIINQKFWNRKRREYRVDCNHQTQVDDPTRLENLPTDVLEGWLAHEVGHVMDYHSRGWFNLIWLGIQYLINSKRKREAEHQADLYAIEYGFAEKILATKRYILDHSDIAEAYKERIRKYYMTPEDVERAILTQDKPILGVDDAKVL